jgi:hypothetical protein
MSRKSGAGTGKGKALDDDLRGMFRALEQRPLPDRLRSLVDQLDEGEASPQRKAKGG